jgi:ABC-2 type transport system permease protein
MTRLIRTELLKLRTTRLPYGVAGIAATLTAMFALLEGSRAGQAASGVPSLSTAAGLSTVTTVTGIAMLLAAVLGVMVAAGEFRHQSATLTYLAAPNRTRVLWAKALAAAGAGALIGLLAGVVATAIGLTLAAGRHDSIALCAGTLAAHVAGAAVGAALLAAAGVALGSLIRSQIAGVIAIFVWAMVIESAIGGLFTQVRPYLPYTAATTMAGAKLGNAAFGPAHGLTAGAGPLPFAAAVALLVAIAMAIGGLAARTTLQADIA